MTCKEYKKGCCANLWNSRVFRDWTDTLDIRTDHHLILRDNRECFANVFGKAHFHYRSEFTYCAWSLKFKNNEYVLLTARDKGTCIEIVKDNNQFELDDNPEYIEFGKWLLDKIKGKTNDK